jgi:hypothetical protein
LASQPIKEDDEVKTRFTPFFLILFIIAAAFLSRFVGDSDYLYAQTTGIYNYAYQFFFCPYNRKPFTTYPNLYPGYPTYRIPYPYAYPLPKLYPCPCTTPAIDTLLMGDYEQ